MADKRDLGRTQVEQVDAHNCIECHDDELDEESVGDGHDGLGKRIDDCADRSEAAEEAQHTERPQQAEYRHGDVLCSEQRCDEADHDDDCVEDIPRVSQEFVHPMRIDIEHEFNGKDDREAPVHVEEKVCAVLELGILRRCFVMQQFWNLLGARACNRRRCV